MVIGALAAAALLGAPFFLALVLRARGQTA